MLKRLKQRWHDIAERRPGHRFRERYALRAKSSGSARTINLAIGIVLIAAGVVLLVIPGPGLLLIAVGAAFVAVESKAIAHMLDWAEVVGRKLFSRFTRRGQSMRS